MNIFDERLKKIISTIICRNSRNIYSQFNAVLKISEGLRKTMNIFKPMISSKSLILHITTDIKELLFEFTLYIMHILISPEFCGNVYFIYTT